MSDDTHSRSPDEKHRAMARLDPPDPENRLPIPGDPEYPDWIDARCHKGWITEHEWIECRKLHAFVGKAS